MVMHDDAGGDFVACDGFCFGDEYIGDGGGGARQNVCEGSRSRGTADHSLLAGSREELRHEEGARVAPCSAMLPTHAQYIQKSSLGCVLRRSILAGGHLGGK